jgi:hypothetical protein
MGSPRLPMDAKMFPSACSKGRWRCGWLDISLLSAQLGALEQDWLKITSVLNYHTDDNSSSLSLVIPRDSCASSLTWKKTRFEGVVIVVMLSDGD